MVYTNLWVMAKGEKSISITTSPKCLQGSWERIFLFFFVIPENKQQMKINSTDIKETKRIIYIIYIAGKKPLRLLGQLFILVEASFDDAWEGDRERGRGPGQEVGSWGKPGWRRRGGRKTSSGGISCAFQSDPSILFLPLPTETEVASQSSQED